MQGWRLRSTASSGIVDFIPNKGDKSTGVNAQITGQGNDNNSDKVNRKNEW